MLAALAALAQPAAAAPSLCAHLPETGTVAQPGPPEQLPARLLPNRSFICPPGYSLDATARLPLCQRPGRRLVPGNPRAACLAALPLGPLAPVPAQWRPTRSCPAGPIRAFIRLEGVNAGLADVALRSDAPGVTLETLEDASPGLAPAERPTAQGCFAHSCRLVRISVAADAPDTVRLRLAVKDGASTELAVPVITHCPDPVGAPGHMAGLRGGQP